MTLDARLGTDGDLLDDTYRSLISGDDLVRQRMIIRLQRHFREWFLDNTLGLPFEAWVQQKPPDLGQITARVRTEVRNTSGVVSVGEFTATHDLERRLVRIEGTFVTAAGTTDGLTVEGVSNLGTGSNSSPWAIFFRSGAIHGAPGGLPNSPIGVAGG